MHWRRLLRDIGDVAVLSLAYPQSVNEFLDRLRSAVDADGGAGGASPEMELGVDLGLVNAKLRQTRRPGPQGLRASLEMLARHHRDRHQLACLLIDDVDLLRDSRQALLQLRAISLELYASDLPIALVVAASPTLFAGIGSAHESLVRYYEPLTVGPLEPSNAELAVSIPLRGTGVTFDRGVLADIASASAGRPYYIQKLAYYAFDAAVDGRVGLAEYRVGFERAFAAVSQEIFASRWGALSPSEQAVVRLLADGAEPRRSGEVEALARTRRHCSRGDPASAAAAGLAWTRRSAGKWPPRPIHRRRSPVQALPRHAGRMTLRHSRLLERPRAGRRPAAHPVETQHPPAGSRHTRRPHRPPRIQAKARAQSELVGETPAGRRHPRDFSHESVPLDRLETALAQLVVEAHEHDLGRQPKRRGAAGRIRVVKEDEAA